MGVVFTELTRYSRAIIERLLVRQENLPRQPEG
jgi:hypothetical protein